jgi:hypothetical protein
MLLCNCILVWISSMNMQWHCYLTVSSHEIWKRWNSCSSELWWHDHSPVMCCSEGICSQKLLPALTCTNPWLFRTHYPTTELSKIAQEIDWTAKSSFQSQYYLSVCCVCQNSSRCFSCWLLLCLDFLPGICSDECLLQVTPLTKLTKVLHVSPLWAACVIRLLP